MGNNGHSERNFSGGYTHYDSHGNKTGSSEPDFFGGFTEYDARGHKIGHTDEDFFGGYNHYDNHGNKVGHSSENFSGGYNHYDSHGNRTGTSDPSFSGGYSNSSGEGCYIATCVYGSYDCPEVWTLRRFRDYKLAQSLLGRAFIRCYYTVSPTVVKLFGERYLFRTFWKNALDLWVSRLHKQGYADDPYEDRRW